MRPLKPHACQMTSRLAQVRPLSAVSVPANQIVSAPAQVHRLSIARTLFKLHARPPKCTSARSSGTGSAPAHEHAGQIETTPAQACPFSSVAPAQHCARAGGVPCATAQRCARASHMASTRVPSHPFSALRTPASNTPAKW